jgi:hypothetical protein
MKKWLISLFAAVTLITSIPVYAEPIDDTVRSTVLVKLQGLNDTLSNSYTGKDGLYYNLYYLAIKAEWVSFMYDFNNTMNLGFSLQDKQAQRKSLIDNISKFNMIFSVQTSNSSYVDESQQYVPLKLSDSVDPDDFVKVVKDFTANSVPTYLENRLKDLKVKFDQASTEEDKEGVLSSSKDELISIYRILNVLLFEKDNLSPMLLSGDFYIPGSPKSQEIMKNTSYTSLIAKARDFSSSQSAFDTSLEESDSNIYLEKLAWVKKKTAASAAPDDLGYSVWSTLADPSGTKSDQYKLRDAYIRMFAASSVYRPLVSHVGDEEYLEALGALFPDDVRQRYLALFDQIKDYKKPVYSIYDSSKWYQKLYPKSSPNAGPLGSSVQSFSGTAKIITVKEFLKGIKDEDLMGLTTLKGKLKVSETDINSYSYFNDNPKFSNDPEFGVPFGEEPDNTPVATDADPGDVEDEDNPSPTTSPTKNSGELNSIIQNAAEEVTSTKWTNTFVEVGKPSKDGFIYYLPSLSTATFKNYFKDLNYGESLSKSDNSYLYMNVFGDIVNKDNLVIIPGAANPAYYSADEGYYPYNVMFMKGYPSMANVTGELILGSPQNKGKYLLFSSKDSANGNHTFFEVKGDSNFAVTSPRISNWVTLKLMEPIKGIGNPFTLNDVTSLTGNAWTTMKFLYSNTFGVTPGSADYLNNTVLKQDVPVGDVNLMSYDPSEDTDYRVAKYISRNMYLFLSEKVSGSRRLKEDFMFKNILVEALNGTTYSSGYERLLNESVGKLMENQYDWWTNAAYNLGKTVSDGALGQIDGVLGVRDTREDPLFSKIREVIDNYYIYIIITVVAVFLIRYIRNKANFLYTIWTIASVIVISTLFLKALPMYIPYVYNFVTANKSSDLAYKVLQMKTEKYTKVYSPNNELDKYGNYLKATTSIDLYHLTDAQRKEISEHFNVSLSRLDKGHSEIIDSNVGMYFQGNTIKLNLDMLFSGNPITASYQDTPYGRIYQLTADKMFSSSIDYYTPFYLIEDGFVDTLNRFLLAYKIPKFSLDYGGGLTKDAYIVYNYTNSLPFLSPGSYELTDGSVSPSEADKLKSMFDDIAKREDSRDFLSLYKIFENPSQEMMNSLWYRSMVAKGINPEGTEEEKQNFIDLLESVNTLTKRAINDMDIKGGNLSDENLIKNISLYATMIFNQKISQTWKYNVYPKVLNYGEFKLADILQAVLTEDYRLFVNSNQDLMQYARDNLDGITFMVLIFLVVLLAITIFILHYSIPALVALLFFALAAKVIMGDSIKAPLMGYLKLSFILFLCMVTLTISMALREGKSTTWSTYILMVPGLVVTLVVFTCLTAVLLDPLDMGNNKLNSLVTKFLNSKLMKPITDRLNATLDRLKKPDIEKTVAETSLRRHAFGARMTEFLDYDAKDLRSLRPKLTDPLDKHTNSLDRAYIFEAERSLREANSNSRRRRQS